MSQYVPATTELQLESHVAAKLRISPLINKMSVGSALLPQVLLILLSNTKVNMRNVRSMKLLSCLYKPCLPCQMRLFAPEVRWRDLFVLL